MDHPAISKATKASAHQTASQFVKRFLLGGNERRSQGSNADGHLTPTGNAGKGSGTLHRLANVLEVVHRPVVQRGRLFFLRYNQVD